MADGARLARIFSSAAGVEADAAQQARDLGRPDDEAAAIAAARAYADQAREAASRTFAAAMPEAAAMVLVAEAEAVDATGTPDPELWARAADAWAAIDRPFRVARVRWREAEAALATGDRARAEAAGTDALALATRLGAALARRGADRARPPRPPALRRLAAGRRRRGGEGRARQAPQQRPRPPSPTRPPSWA